VLLETREIAYNVFMIPSLHIRNPAFNDHRCRGRDSQSRMSSRLLHHSRTVALEIFGSKLELIYTMASQTPVKLGILDSNHHICSTASLHNRSLQGRDCDFQRHAPLIYVPKITDAGRKQLVDRLRPFTVLSTMRERTLFPGELLRQLPNL
jgi:hypothetical protein